VSDSLAASARVSAGGAEVEVLRIVPPAADAATLVFLHEGLGCAAQWRGIPRRLAERLGCGALVYSRAGYGDSAPAPLPRPIDFMHREARHTLPELLGALDVEAPILFGHSDGASIALIYAGSGLSPVPRALVLEAPHLFVEPVCVESIARLARRFDEDADLRRRFERLHGAQAAETVRGWCEVWLRPAFASSFDLGPLLGHIDCPVLALQGLEDEYGTPAQIERLRKGVRGPVEIVLLPGCGHAPHRDREEDVLSLAARFLGSRAG
jgi:pimeloyl-ACP methyl ester carboxylesterase